MSDSPICVVPDTVRVEPLAKDTLIRPSFHNPGNSTESLPRDFRY